MTYCSCTGKHAEVTYLHPVCSHPRSYEYFSKQVVGVKMAGPSTAASVHIATCARWCFARGQQCGSRRDKILAQCKSATGSNVLAHLVPAKVDAEIPQAAAVEIKKLC